MSTTYTLTEARRKLAAIVSDLEDTDHIELTRDGQPVAVLLSPRAYHQLRPPPKPAGGFWEATLAWRKTVNWAEMEGPDPFPDVRDRSPGRDVNVDFDE